MVERDARRFHWMDLSPPHVIYLALVPDEAADIDVEAVVTVCAPDGA
jgi:hypothetical protein